MYQLTYVCGFFDMLWTGIHPSCCAGKIARSKTTTKQTHLVQRIVIELSCVPYSWVQNNNCLKCRLIQFVWLIWLIWVNTSDVYCVFSTSPSSLYKQMLYMYLCRTSGRFHFWRAQVNPSQSCQIMSENVGFHRK